jgi:hypothetical protein
MEYDLAGDDAAMIVVGLLVFIATTVLFLVWRTLRGQAVPISDVSELTSRLQPVDLVAFKNLVDAEDQKYIETQLPLSDVRVYRRLRARAAISYLRLTAHNAAVLVRLGESAAKSNIHDVSQRGQALAQLALSVRLSCLVTIARLWATVAFPILSLAVFTDWEQRVAMMYESIKPLALAQHPGVPQA